MNNNILCKRFCERSRKMQTKSTNPIESMFTHAATAERAGPLRGAESPRVFVFGAPAKKQSKKTRVRGNTARDREAFSHARLKARKALFRLKLELTGHQLITGRG